MEEEFYICPDGRKLTCAMIIQNAAGDILGCHSTGKKWGKTSYDLPKGHMNTSDLDPLDAAIRECYEETGWDLSDYENDIVDLGEHEYTNEKNIHLFYLAIEIPDLETFKCKSTFENKWGRQTPEVNGFALIKENEHDYFFKTIQDVLKKVNI